MPSPRTIGAPPSVIGLPFISVIVKGSVSGSVSFAKTSTVTGVFIAVVSESSTATGGLLIEAVALAVPAEMTLGSFAEKVAEFEPTQGVVIATVNVKETC